MLDTSKEFLENSISAKEGEITKAILKEQDTGFKAIEVAQN